MQDELQNVETLYGPASQQSRDGSASLVPALVVEGHPQLDRVGEICWLPDLLEGKALALGRNVPDFCRPDTVIGTPLNDPYISRTPIRLSLLSSGEVELNCADSKIDLLVNGEPVKQSIKLTAEQLSIGAIIGLGGRITLLLKLLKPSVHASATSFNMVGVSPQLQTVVERLQHIMGIDEPVLIRGPTGVGKELVAEAIVEVSNRIDQPFVKISLAAIAPSLAAAELFGVKKGAFSGADKDRSGYFVAAQGGTLFLDEIGEASAEVQSMLLRVLETGELYPVGSDTPEQVDVRIIAATDANLEQQCEEKKFKLPLLHRLASYEILLPPLHERREDIGPLFLHFCKQQFSRLEQQHPVKLPYTGVALMPNELMYLLLNFHWPGNIRQLRNITRQLIIDNLDDDEISIPEQIRDQLTGSGDIVDTRKVETVKPRRRKPSTVASDELRQALIANAWELQATAEQLNITRSSIYELMERYGFKTAADISSDVLEKSFRRCNANLDEMVIDLHVSRHALIRRLKELGLMSG